MSEPFTPADIAIIRRGFARQLVSTCGIEDNAALELAFSKVAREDFLGVPPWLTSVDLGKYQEVSIFDPVAVYQDLVFALDPARGINNGSPSLHTRWLDTLKPMSGERVAHIGAGSGYYTAIIAELVGPDGFVLAVEFDPILAAAATANLSHYQNVLVVQGDGIKLPDGPTDCIYVNFGVELPMAAWINNLREGGRLIFPLGYRRENSIAGGGFLLQRDGSGISARFLGPAYFFPAEGEMQVSTDYRERMHTAFEHGQPSTVRRLVWQTKKPEDGIWFAGDDWALCEDRN
ncbi:MAG: protein-L-isoaspartate O-methyltransferase [Acidithiobacillus sp.]